MCPKALNTGSMLRKQGLQGESMKPQVKLRDPRNESTNRCHIHSKPAGQEDLSKNASMQSVFEYILRASILLYKFCLVKLCSMHSSSLQGEQDAIPHSTHAELVDGYSSIWPRKG